MTPELEDDGSELDQLGPRSERDQDPHRPPDSMEAARKSQTKTEPVFRRLQVKGAASSESDIFVEFPTKK